MTDEEINALSDEQINEMIEWLEYLSADYCSDAGYMMPIANENLISITYGFRGGVLVCEASSLDSEFHSGCMEPEKYCRAAAIVYLKMKGVL